MPRVSVPDDYEGGMINVCGYADSQYEHADVQVEDRHARTLTVREDDEGRYCGPPATHAEAVAEYLGVDYTPPEPEEDDEDEDSGGGESEEDNDSGTCETIKGDDEVCGRDLPCPYHSEDS